MLSVVCHCGVLAYCQLRPGDSCLNLRRVCHSDTVCLALCLGLHQAHLMLVTGCLHSAGRRGKAYGQQHRGVGAACSASQGC